MSHPITPERIMQASRGYWVTGILSAATTHRIFTHIAGGLRTADMIAEKAGISRRGAQALLDGLLAAGFVTLADGAYDNAPDAAQFLVEGKPTFIGAMNKLAPTGMKSFSDLAEVVKRGGPPPEESLFNVKENPYWEKLTPAIAPLSFPGAQYVATKLGVATRGPLSILDIGGGAGVFSAVFLGANKEARATQLDWANVNRIARGFVGNFGVGDRFTTLDGDFHSTDLGSGYDFVVYSNMAHGESPRSNTEVFKRIKKALKPGGTLLIQDFVINDDRTADDPYALLFHASMLIGTAEGAVWRKADFKGWLTEAGFEDVVVEKVPVGPATMIYAK
jgi:SAM-dependent methyltransferase